MEVNAAIAKMHIVDRAKVCDRAMVEDEKKERHVTELVEIDRLVRKSNVEVGAIVEVVRGMQAGMKKAGKKPIVVMAI